MVLEEFQSTLSLPTPPSDFSLHQKTLWFAGKGDWEKAHHLVQEMNDRLSSRIHAFLHRQEGDISNASYWYSKTGAVLPEQTIKEEWEDLVRRC